MKNLILALFTTLGFNTLVAQINNQPATNGAPATTITQPNTSGTQSSSPDFSTSHISTAPIPTPITPTMQTTIPGAETQAGENTQYPSGDNNSSNANSNSSLNNNGIINSPPKN
ncbi:MAG: hypothetical protein ABI448_14315 [Bacteroidia bacterium]